MPAHSRISIRRFPQGTHLKVLASYHKAFQIQLDEEVPWQRRRWEKSPEEGWIIWVHDDYWPVLERLAYLFDQAYLYDERTQRGQDLHSGRTWGLEPPVEQLDLFSA
jgi:hypothetical protein